MTEFVTPIVFPIFWLTVPADLDVFAVVPFRAQVRLEQAGSPVEDFAWGWPQQSVDFGIRVLFPSWPPPQPGFAAPNGQPWDDLPRLSNGSMLTYRVRSDTGDELLAPGGESTNASIGNIFRAWTTGPTRAGPTGSFTLRFPSSPAAFGDWNYLDDTYDIDLYPDDVNFPGVNVETPLTYKARPSVGVSGQLLTAIDGGAP